MTKEQLEADLQALIEETVGEAPSVLLGVHAPFQHLDWAGAAGEFERNTNLALSPASGFRIASMSKTFTGVLCAQLIERGFHLGTVDLSAELDIDAVGSVRRHREHGY